MSAKRATTEGSSSAGAAPTITIRRKKTSPVERLAEAKRAYFAGDAPIMRDDEYDAEELIVSRENPDAAIISEVGWTPSENTLPLPVPMPSLKKVKPAEASWQRWYARQSGKMMWSAKLDGISALWIPGQGKLLNRGDGLTGSDLSRCAVFVAGLVKAAPTANIIIRGEILMRRSEAPEGLPSLRSYVNGQLRKHSATDSRYELPPAGHVRFVAYRVLSPPTVASLGIQEQFAWLMAQGYEVAPHSTFQLGGLEQTEELLAQTFTGLKETGPYELDGLVLSSATATLERPHADASEPDDMVAFKMPLAEQCAETTVQEVEWNLSRNGMLIPRILINPVVIQGVTIRRLTGHNAKFIAEERIGRGARIRIRRSGDVIPIVDAVIARVEPQMPPAGTWVYEGVHAKPSAADVAYDRQLHHALQVLGVKGCGPSLATAMVAAGILTPFDLAHADLSVVQEALGKSNGQKLKDAAAAAIASASHVAQILSCPDLPNGIGESRIKAFVDAGADFAGPAPEGMGTATFDLLKAAEGKIREWMSHFPQAMAAVAAPAVARRGAICLTGFRDAAWKGQLEARGWEVKNTLTRDCSMLVIPAGEDPATYESTKVAQAQKYGIRVLNRTAAERELTNH